MHVSKISITEDRKKSAVVDAISAIYEIVRDHFLKSGQLTVKYDDILRRIIAKGYTERDLTQCLTEYSNLNIWQVDDSRENIRFLT
jgi:DNA replication licensing factor MCM7